MKKIIVSILLLMFILINQSYAIDYNIANVTKIECIKHSSGDIIKFWIGDKERVYVKNNGVPSYEGIWLDGDNYTKYSGNNILIVCNIVINNIGKNYSKLVSLSPGDNNIDWTIEDNEFNFIINIPSSTTAPIETTTPDITTTPIDTSTPNPLTTAPTTQNITPDTTTPDITTQPTTTNEIITITPNNNINNANISKVNNNIQELPQTYDTYDLSIMLCGVFIILCGILYLIYVKKRGV